MQLDYVPLLQVMRELYSIPRGQFPDFNGMERFRKYLRTISSPDGSGLEFPPLVIMNPMAKEHVPALLDSLLALDADGIAAKTVAEASAALADEPGEFKVTLVVIDDWGGWSNRGSHEYNARFPSGTHGSRLPRWTKHAWVTGVLWSSETASARAVREAILTAIYRMAYSQRHGRARTLRAMMAQEGYVMARAGCSAPVLDTEDLAYTREVLTPHLEAEDMRTAIECLFGDMAAKPLGFTPRGLSPWAGLALALHDALEARALVDAAVAAGA